MNIETQVAGKTDRIRTPESDAYYTAVAEVLRDPQILGALQPYLNGGAIRGHWVLDRDMARKIMVEMAPEEYQPALQTDVLNDWQKLRLMSAVIGTHFVRNTNNGLFYPRTKH
jgi:hypothetical protein